MNRKLLEKRVIRDPIHGYIHIEDSVIWDCINTREFQRLRRVRQLGSTLMVFPSGEHSRITHCLGAYEVARRFVNEVDDLALQLTDREKLTVMAAALLHDVGHLPFSHSFENVVERRHEDYTVQLIASNSEISEVLRQVDDAFPYEVASVINHTHPNPILGQLISSQLDADRLDYLLRDSYFTGTSYGQIDLDRIIRTMRVKDGRVVVKKSSMYTIENYIMARYHMYWQVYYHRNSRSFDVLLKEIFIRLRDLYLQDASIVEDFPMYKDLLENEVLSNDQLFWLDDSSCTYSFHLMMQHKDPILRDLSRRILTRDLFDYTSLEEAENYRDLCLRKGYDPRYYLVADYQKQVPYQPYLGEKGDGIWVLMDDGSIKEFSEVSEVVRAISQINEEDERVFFPKEILDD